MNHQSVLSPTQQFFPSITSVSSVSKSKQKSRGLILCFPPAYLRAWSYLHNPTGPPSGRRAKVKVPCKSRIQLGSQFNSIHVGWIVHAKRFGCQFFCWFFADFPRGRLCT